MTDGHSLIYYNSSRIIIGIRGIAADGIMQLLLMMVRVPARVGDAGEVLLGFEHGGRKDIVVVVFLEKVLHGVPPEEGDRFLHRLIVLVLPLGVRIADIEIVFIL